MDKTEKAIVATTAAIAMPLIASAVVLKIKSRKLGKRIGLRMEILDLLQMAKTAGTEEESDEFIVKALAAFDKLDPKKFKKTFGV